MSNVNYTLFKTLSNNQPVDYQLQITTDFTLSNHQNDGQEIIAVPQQNGDLLHVKVKIKPGNDSHIVHDFSIGDFPLNGVDSWYLKIEVYDENGIKVKEEAQTEQAEIHAQPRPTKINSFFHS